MKLSERFFEATERGSEQLFVVENAEAILSALRAAETSDAIVTERDGFQWERNAAIRQMDECYRDLAALRAENERLMGVVDGIWIYGSDTLSGRIDGPETREWYRNAVTEITTRARAAISTYLEAVGEMSDRTVKAQDG